jgi:hypothetical protein
MSKKSASDTLSRNMELINKKVREINERRRGVKITRVEDDLDRQELKSYIRFMGVEQGDISLESAETEKYFPRDKIFYATLAIEGLIELTLFYITLSYLLMPNPGTTEYIMATVLMGMFGYLGYIIYKSLRSK